jgi:molecular chaperone GrpE
MNEEDRMEELVKPAEEEVERIKEELEAERQRREDYHKKLLYAMAEIENMRKRFERDKEEILKYAEADLLKDILPVLDNMERALSSSNVGDVDDMKKGLDLIYRQFLDILKKRGLTQIDAKGMAFDPLFHEAVEIVERDDVPEGMVVEEVQKGYLFKDRLIRPALVKVSKRPEEGAEEERR